MKYLALEMGCFVEVRGLPIDVDAFLISLQERISNLPSGARIVQAWDWLHVEDERPEASRAEIVFFMAELAFAERAITTMRNIALEHPQLTVWFYGDYFEAGWGQRALLANGMGSRSREIEARSNSSRKNSRPASSNRCSV